MKSLIRISHTAKELYLRCPRSYYFKYVLKLREETLGSPLFFGGNVEKGANVLLKGGKLELAHKVFERSMRNKFAFNKKYIDLSKSPLVKYSKADFQEHLFSEKELKDMENKDYNFKAHESLIRSGKLMINEFQDSIIPKIKKVHEIQKYYKIVRPSVDGMFCDEIFGYADLICEWEDGRMLVPDIKTSSTKYGDNALENIEKGTQTAAYYSGLKDEYELDGAGFLVLRKKILKGRGKAAKPHAKSEIVIGTPSDEIINKTFDQYDTVVYNIKMGNFPEVHNCDMPWGECPYKKFHNSGGIITKGLIKA